MTMTNKERGLKALKEKRFTEAVIQLRRHLLEHPHDSDARIELGLAQLFGGNESGFLESHMKAETELAGHESHLLELSRSMFARVTQAAAVVTMVALPAMAGCDKKSEESSSSTATTPMSGPATPNVVTPPAMDPPSTEPMLPAMQPPPPDGPMAGMTATTDMGKPALPSDMKKEPDMKKPVMKYPAKKYGVRPRPQVKMKYGISRPVYARYRARRPTTVNQINPNDF